MADRKKKESTESGAPVSAINDDVDTLKLRVLTPDSAVDSTLSTHSDFPKSPPFPVKDWDHYEFIQVLGEGGMGTVYLARDMRLNRFVALKFIRGGDAVRSQRFMQEAKSQARIEHDHVCKVYEVGEVEGQPYIAMQYIQGESVQSARKKMSLEQKAKVIKDAAEALHAAHRLGIIHRDIKPANIMVERDDDGSWLARVMDFGLARDTGAKQQLTETGMIMGTPSYMSPEQARGDSRVMDRRSDVYSLGATLYEMVCGRPPFEGSTGYQTLNMVVNDEPKPLRKIIPAIPTDLDTITMQCLEKDPQRRYDSSKALADDLQRYLDGEPIRAKQLSWTYRVVKQAQKHRAILAVGSMAIIAMIVFSIVAIHARITLNEQTRLAQKFGQEAERIEGILQRSYLLPLHDISSEIDMVEARMNSIREWMKQAGGIGEQTGSYALGRGYMALHNYEEARKHLELARKGADQEQNLDYLLGQVLGELYHRKLEEAERLSNKELREARKKEIEKSYLEPALQYLSEYMNRGRAGMNQTAYAEGQIAFYKGAYVEALNKAREAAAQSPWMYEARKLEGDASIALGKDKIEKGDYVGGMGDLECSGESYRQAMEIGRSDPAIYAGEAERWIQVMDLEVRYGGSPKTAFENAVAFCDKALLADPQNIEVLNKKSRSYWRWGEYQDRHGEDPIPSLDLAIEIAQKAVALNSQDADAYTNLSNAHRRKGEYQMRHGTDPEASIATACESIDKAIAINPNDISAYNTLGLIYEGKGLYERNRGKDPRPSWNKAVESFQKVTNLNTNFIRSYNNIGVIYAYKAEYEMRFGRSPKEMLEKAEESYNAANRLNPNYANAYIGLGLVYHTKGLYEMRRGESPRETLDKAIVNYQKAIKLNPNHAFPHNALGYSFHLRARYDMETGGDPTQYLNLSRGILERSIEIDSSDSFGYANLGVVETISGQWAMRRGQSPEQSFEKARRHLQKAVELDPGTDFFLQATAELHRRRAEWILKKNGKPTADIKLGLEAARKAVSLNPQNSEAAAVEGALELLQAHAEKNKEAARRAQAILEKTLQANPLLKRDFDPVLNEAKNF